MKAPDDISDFEPADEQSNHAHYDQDSDHSGNFSLSTTGLDHGEGADEFLVSGVDSVDADLAEKKTAGCTLAELLAGRNVFLVRHGRSEKAPGGDDSDRKLEPAAERQCSAFLSSYGSEMERIKYAFASPTDRTRETSSFLGHPDPVTVPYLYFKNYYTDDMQRLDDELGYAPLSAYLGANEGTAKDLYAPVQAELGRQLAAALGKELDKAKAMGEWEGDVIVVTHAITISLLALEVLKALKEGAGGDDAGTGGDACPEEDKVLAMDVGEVEGFSISSSGKVQLLKIEI